MTEKLLSFLIPCVKMIKIGYKKSLNFKMEPNYAAFKDVWMILKETVFRCERWSDVTRTAHC